MKKRNLFLIGICLVVVIVFCVGFFIGDKIEKMCVKECKNIDMNFGGYKESESYGFVQCSCIGENASKTLYFDLDTGEQLSSGDILGRVVG